MYCENCGKEMEENSKFCQNCGTPVGSKNSIENMASKEKENSVSDNVAVKDCEFSEQTNDTISSTVKVDPKANVFKRILHTLKKHRKKITVVAAAAVLVAVITFGCVLLVRNQKRSKIIKEIPAQLAGNVYASTKFIDDKLVWFGAEVFNEDGSKYSSYVYFNTDSGLSIHNLTKDNPLPLKKNLFGKKIKFGRSEFDYTKSSDSINSYNSYSTYSVADVYSALLNCEFEGEDKDEYEKVAEELKTAIESSKGFDDLKEEIYQTAAVNLLEDYELYGLSFNELYEDCVKDTKYVGMEYNDDNNAYIFTYNCKYAPNKRDLPNMYEEGELVLTYYPDKNKVVVSGSVYSGLEVYAIMKAYSYY